MMLRYVSKIVDDDIANFRFGKYSLNYWVSEMPLWCLLKYNFYQFAQQGKDKKVLEEIKKKVTFTYYMAQIVFPFHPLCEWMAKRFFDQEEKNTA